MYGYISTNKKKTKNKGGKKAKTWKKRWLVLFEKSLRYYANQVSKSLTTFLKLIFFYFCVMKKNRTEEKGFIDLTTAGNVLALEDAYKGRKFCFTIETPNRLYFIQTFSDTEINQWVFYIRDMIDNAKVISISFPTTTNKKWSTKKKVRKAIPLNDVSLKVHPEASWDSLPLGWKMHYNHTLARPYFVDYNNNKKTTYQDPSKREENKFKSPQISNS